MRNWHYFLRPGRRSRCGSSATKQIIEPPRAMMFPRVVVGELSVAVPIFGGRRRRRFVMRRRPAPPRDDAPTPVPEHARGIRHRGRGMAAPSSSSAAAAGRGRRGRRMWPVAAAVRRRRRRRRRRVGGGGGEEVGRVRNLPSPRVVAVRRWRGPGSGSGRGLRRRRRDDAADRVLPLRRIAAAAGVPSSGILVVDRLVHTKRRRGAVVNEHTPLPYILTQQPRTSPLTDRFHVARPLSLLDYNIIISPA